MKKRGNTKSALLRTVLALLICVSLFIGSTFAWFSDTAATGINKIVAGNLDVKLWYSTDMSNWSDAETATDIFTTDKWEPGYTQVVYFKIENAGALAFKYKVGTNMESEVEGINQANETFKLSDYLEFGIAVPSAVYADRETARAAIESSIKFSDFYTEETVLEAGDDKIFAMIVWMPENTGNEANHNGTEIPEIQFGINVIAGQATAEFDSFDNQYDHNSEYPATATKVENETEFVKALDDGEKDIVLTNDITFSSVHTIEDASRLAIYGDGKSIMRSSGNTGNIFVVPETASLKLVDVVVDGGADEFKINMDGYPTVDENSIPADMPKTSAPAIVSSGAFAAENLSIVNQYSDGTHNSALQILGGTAKISNSDFSHNYSPNQGAAVSVGVDSGSVTEYAVEEVVFDNCSFHGNITDKGGSGGGALYIVNTKVVRIQSCEFIGNAAMSYNCGGGAVFFGRNGSYAILKSLEDSDPTNDLPFVQAYIDDCIFDNNHSGNDGFAVNNECADLYITNSIFTNNVGHAGNSSVGTVSCMPYAAENGTWFKLYMDNCTMNNNDGAAAMIGNHGTLMDMKLTNCTMNGNVGSVGILLYSGKSIIENCSFADNLLDTAVVDIRSYMSDEMYNPYLAVKDVKITGTIKGSDILIRKNQGNLSYTDSEVTVQGNTTASVTIQDNTWLRMEGILNGDIIRDANTPVTHILISGTHNGNMN